MPNKKISELTENLVLRETDLIPIVDQTAGITKKVTGNTLVNFTNTSLRSLSSNWESTYSSVNITSGSWNETYSHVSAGSAVWNSAPSLFLALSGGRVLGDTIFNQSLTIYGNLTALGKTTFADSIVTATSALSVINIGNGDAFTVINKGPGNLASFIDRDTGIEIFHIGGINGASFAPFVGVYTPYPNKELTVTGEISATGNIWSSGKFKGDGSEITSLNPNEINGKILNETLPSVATFTNSVSAPALSGMFYGDGSNLTGVIKTQYVLPEATDSVLGGVKVDNTTIVINNGIISYTPPANATFTSSVSAPALSGMFYGDGSNLTNLQPYTLPTASTSVLGGVKVDGTTIGVQDGVIRHLPPANATFTSSVSAPALSGVHFGDGSQLTGVVKTPYTPPANATFTSSVSAPALSGVHFGDGSQLTGVVKVPYSLPIASSSMLGGVRVDGTTINISSNGTIRVVEGTGGSGQSFTLSAAAINALGGIRIDGSSTTVDSQGFLKLIESDVSINYDLNKAKLWEKVNTFLTIAQPLADVNCSIDGRYLVAARENGSISIYVDGEFAYNSSTPAANSWGKVAISSTGQYITGLTVSGLIWVSNNYGVTFQQKANSNSWVSIAMSSNGQYQTAVAINAKIYTSADFGETWTPIDESRWWLDVAMSFDGKYQIACVAAQNLYVSTDYGSTWTSVVNITNKDWSTVAMSFDGRFQYAVESTNLYKSSNYGVSFTAIVLPENFSRLKVSSSGQDLIGLATNGTLYLSNDGGTTWRFKTINAIGDWKGLAVSGNGSKQFVAINNTIYKGEISNLYFNKPLSATTFYGDGSNLTNIAISVPIATSLVVGGIRVDGDLFVVDNTGLLSYNFPANATFATSVSSRTLSGMFYGDGSFLANLNANSISSGTLSNSRLPAVATFATSVSAPELSGSFYGEGAFLTNLNADSISTGTLSNSRLPSVASFATSVSSTALSGSFYGDGSFLANLNANSISSGTLSNSRLPSVASFATSVSSAALSGSFYGEGAFLTNLNADSISSGTLNNSRMPAVATFATSVSAPELSGLFIGDGSRLTGVAATGGFATDLTKLPLSGGMVSGDLTVTGSFSAAGPITFVGNTVFTSASSLSVVNISQNGEIPALYVGQSGLGDIASFYDIDQGIEVLHIGGQNGSNPNVGIKTSTPNKTLTVSGEISATGDVYSSGSFYGDGSKLTGTYDGTDVKALSGVWQDASTKVQANSAVWTSGPKFVSDLTVSLPGGKTFGRYSSGDVIAATGKTAAEVIQMAIVAPIEPTVSLTSPTTIAFNQTSISNTLEFSRTINSLGASIASASLQWRRNNSGPWFELSTDTSSSGNFVHVTTNSNFNTQTFNYRYIVTDNQGATATATVNITPSSYAAPTISLTVAAASITSPETNNTREKGNINSNISGTISTNSVDVVLVSYTLQYQIDGGSWTDIGSSTSIAGNYHTINSTNHNPTGFEAANTIGYRIKVVDQYTTIYSSAVVINFYNLIFYGSSSSVPINSSDIRSLTNRIFTNGTNPIILNTGTSVTKFTVAVPSSLSVAEVLDLDASSTNLTNNYINNPFNVNDASNVPTLYKVYTLSISTPYGTNHRHQITRA